MAAQRGLCFVTGHPELRWQNQDWKSGLLTQFYPPIPPSSDIASGREVRRRSEKDNTLKP